MNKLTLTKKGYLEPYDCIINPNPVNRVMGIPPTMPEWWNKQCQLIWHYMFKIDEKTELTNVKLCFPEQHVPTAMLQIFWTSVKTLSEEHGVVFDITTSDVNAVGYLSPKEWDRSKVIFDAEKKKWLEYPVTYGYGQKVATPLQLEILI